MKHLSVGITGFIDILGSRQAVLCAKTEHDIQQHADRIQKIQETFDFRSEDDLVKQSNRALKKTVLAFSDCVVVNVPLQSKLASVMGTFDTFMGEITGFGTAQGQCAIEGTFVRGAVDLGWWYYRKDTLVSQSLTRAYLHEGFTGMPVISVTDELYKFLSEHKERKQYTDGDDGLENYIKAEIFKHKQIRFLDYIKLSVQQIHWASSKADHDAYKVASPDKKSALQEAGYQRNQRHWFELHARQIEQAHLKAPAIAKNKYEWLAEYHNQSASAWGMDALALCGLK